MYRRSDDRNDGTVRTTGPGARALAVEATHERIVGVAIEQFSDAWYDDVTVRGIAAAAGVAARPS